MTDKIENAVSFFKELLWNKKKEKVEQKSTQEKDKEKAGTDQLEKAILFFKERRRRDGEETPGISLEVKADETAKITVQQSVAEAPGISFRGVTEEIARTSAQQSTVETPKVSLQDSPDNGDKKKEGWVSPIYSQSRAVHLDPGFIAANRCFAYLEAYRVLRTQLLQRTWGTGNNTIMVTSALPGEGKTLTAINLAFAVASEFRNTVLLVDGDLRKQSIHQYLGCPGEKGLVDYLVDGSPLSELITWPGIEKITFISGGRAFPESSEILGSPRMKELIFDMKGRYPERYIIIDVPPILTGADALILAPLVDLVVVVVQAGKTSIDDVKKALQFLPKEKILGLVLNRC